MTCQIQLQGSVARVGRIGHADQQLLLLLADTCCSSCVAGLDLGSNNVEVEFKRDHSSGQLVCDPSVDKTPL